MTSSETEMKMKSGHNVCDDITVKEKCNIWCKAERYSSITVSDLMFFWVTDFWQTDYTMKVMFCDINSAVMITE